MENIFKIQATQLHISEKEIYQSMGYRGMPKNEYIRQRVQILLTEACYNISPSFCFLIKNGKNTPESVLIDGVSFNTGKVIAQLMERAEQFALFVATTGEEFEKWAAPIKEKDDTMIDTFIIDSIGTCLVESTGDYMEEELQNNIGTLKHTNRFSPGYCGWDIKEQHKLFSMFSHTCNISLTDSSLMRPIKSISGIIGIGQEVSTRKYGCTLCNLTTCYKRKNKK